MKKIVSLIIMVICSYYSNAQENNPFYQVGVDYVTSLKIITEDFRAGKVKDFSKEAIEAYGHTLPLKGEVNMDLAGKIFSTIKAKDFDFVKLVKQSTFSETSKEFFLTAALNPGKFDSKQMEEYLANKVIDIQKSDLGDSEKEMVLSLIAVASHSDELSRIENSSNCTISGPEGSGPIDCGVAGAITGGVIGWSICGPLCGLGGAIIGGVVGSLS